MRVKKLELEISWSNDLKIFNLRKSILEEIRQYGHPLRWAITGVKQNESPLIFRKLFIEAVVIIHSIENN